MLHKPAVTWFVQAMSTLEDHTHTTSKKGTQLLTQVWRQHCMHVLVLFLSKVDYLFETPLSMQSLALQWMLNLDSCMVEILLLFSLLCGIPLCNCGGQVATLKLRCPSNFALGVKGSVTVPKRNSCLWISFCNSNMGRGFYVPGYI